MNGDSHLWLVTALYHMCTVTYIKQYKKVPTHLPITQFKNWFRYIRRYISPIFWYVPKLFFCITCWLTKDLFRAVLTGHGNSGPFCQFEWDGHALKSLSINKMVYNWLTACLCSTIKRPKKKVICFVLYI